MIQPSEILFHPSALHKIMTGVKKKWDVENSLTCKRELVKIYREIKYDRYYTHTNKYTEKGQKSENDSITIYSRYRKEFFKKNKEQLSNEFFTGEPDIILPEETIDVKTSWSLETFPHPLTDEPDDAYVYQGLGYMSLTGAKKHTVAYCLVNAPASLVRREQERLYYEMNCPTLEDGDYFEGLVAIECNMIYDLKQFRSDNPNHDLYCKEWHYDIPLQDRVVEFTIPMNEEDLDKIKNRIKEARLWMSNNLDFSEGIIKPVRAA